MTENTITTTVTFSDLITHNDPELDQLRDAYEDAVEYGTDEYGTDERHAWDSNLRQQVSMYDEAAKAIQSRQHVLQELADEYEDDAFEVKMLSGSELLDLETELRMEAQRKGVGVDALQARRKQLTVDAATVDAPDEVPRDDDGSPVPSECPNPLTIALHEQVESLNTAGGGDFRAPGFGESTGGVASGTSGTLDASSPTSNDSLPSDETTPDSGN